MELYAKIGNSFQSLTISAKHPILDVWLDSEYTSEIYRFPNSNIREKRNSPQVQILPLFNISMGK